MSKGLQDKEHDDYRFCQESNVSQGQEGSSGKKSNLYDYNLTFLERDINQKGRELVFMAFCSHSLNIFLQVHEHKASASALLIFDYSQGI